MRHSMAISALLVGGVLSGCGSSAGQGGPTSPIRSSAPQSLTDQRIASNQQRVRAQPNDVAGIDQLCTAYMQKVRETGDPSYYPKVDVLLQRAREISPADSETVTLTGLLMLARHRFAEGLSWGQKAVALSPTSIVALGVTGDAQVELGLYDDAAATFQKMLDVRPNLTSYSRASYLRELRGDTEGAIAAMRQAVVAGGPYPENVAYVLVLLGQLYFNENQPVAAEEQYRQALGNYPGYAPALAAMGQVRDAQGRYPEAVSFYKQAIAVYPLPQYVIGLGDSYTLMNDATRAGENYDLASAEQKLYQANGVDQDQELAIFDADHHRDLGIALEAARRAVRDRPSVGSFDVLGWTLYQTGAYAEALVASQTAHRLGTRDASFYFHSGMIEAKLGMNREARSDLEAAQAINPHFSDLRVLELRAQLAGLPQS